MAPSITRSRSISASGPFGKLGNPQPSHKRCGQGARAQDWRRQFKRVQRSPQETRIRRPSVHDSFHDFFGSGNPTCGDCGRSMHRVPVARKTDAAGSERRTRPHYLHGALMPRRCDQNLCVRPTETVIGLFGRAPFGSLETILCSSNRFSTRRKTLVSSRNG